MRQVTVAGLCVLLLLACAPSADREREVSQSDAGSQDADASTARDAGQVAAADPAVDLHFLMITLMLEMERTLLARCPCLTAGGQYTSTSQCVSKMSFGRSWIDCVNGLDLSPHDTSFLRESVRCNISQLSLRTECLMGSSCMDEAVAKCMLQSLDCAELPYEALSELTSQCRIAFSR